MNYYDLIYLVGVPIFAFITIVVCVKDYVPNEDFAMYLFACLFWPLSLVVAAAAAIGIALRK